MTDRIPMVATDTHAEADDAILLAAAAASLHSQPSFFGPEPPPNSPDSKADLLAAFGTAQRQSSGRIMLHAEWTDNKIIRKGVWRSLGVPEYLIVPTLYSSEMRWDGTTVEVPEFVEDDEGGFALNLEEARPIMTPADSGCRSALRQLITTHANLVFKPAMGANSKGVLLLSAGGRQVAKSELDLTDGKAAASELLPVVNPESHQPSPSPPGGAMDSAGEDDDNEDAPYVWLSTPIKTWRSRGSAEDRPLPFGQLWREHLIGNPLLRGQFLAEPSIAHDQEVCVLAINGGRLLVLAGRSVIMDRIVRIRGHRPRPEGHGDGDGDGAAADGGAASGAFVAASDFETPEWLGGSSIRNWMRADEATRRRNTQCALHQVVEGDARGRTISEVLLDTAELLAANYFDDKGAAALRVDFFVRWATADAGARVWLNEVENGFNSAALVGWYGERLTLLALRFWLLGGRVAAPGT